MAPRRVGEHCRVLAEVLPAHDHLEVVAFVGEDVDRGEEALRVLVVLPAVIPHQAHRAAGRFRRLIGPAQVHADMEDFGSPRHLFHQVLVGEVGEVPQELGNLREEHVPVVGRVEEDPVGGESRRPVRESKMEVRLHPG